MTMAVSENKPAEAKEPGQTQVWERQPIRDKRTLRLLYSPPGTLRLTVEPNGPDGWEGYSCTTVRLYQAAPLSDPGRYIVLQDGKGEEITMVDQLDYFAPESRPIVEEEIRRRYLTAKVLAVTGIKTEFGITYWNVTTDKGDRDFVVQSLSESCIWLSDRHLLLIDVDGNRFEIVDRTALDLVSQQRLAMVL
jgi:hypothetical protein